MRTLVKDSCLGFIVKDFATNRQCVYGKQEARARTALLHGFDIRKDICKIEILIMPNSQTNTIVVKA
jgi:hypothetical protein